VETGICVKGKRLRDRNVKESGSFGASSSVRGVRELPRSPAQYQISVNLGKRG
jgi:hypothetical protein